MVATCSYYFNSNRNKEGSAEVLIGFKSAFFHYGSIAFGAFMIAMVKTVTSFVGYFGMLCGTATRTV
jgi:hypothetical protein